MKPHIPTVIAFGIGFLVSGVGLHLLGSKLGPWILTLGGAATLVASLIWGS